MLKMPTSHPQDLFDRCFDCRRLNECRRDIREGSKTTERQAMRSCRGQSLDEKINCGAGCQACTRFGKFNSMQTAIAMDLLRRDQRPGERAVASRINRRLGMAGPVADDPGVSGSQFDRDVPGYSSDSQDLEAITGTKCEEDRDCVVLPGIGVDN